MTIDDLLRNNHPPDTIDINNEDLVKFFWKFRGLLKEYERDRSFWEAMNENLESIFETLHDSEQRMKLHFEQTPLGAIEWDLDFRATKWNSAAERIFGFSQGEAVGKHASFIVPVNAKEHVDRVWNDLLAKRGSGKSTNENITRDNRLILCEWHNTPLIDKDGNVVSVASFVQDITEMKNMQDELLKTQKLESLGLMAGGIAHDFNNLLMGIFGNISLARMSVEDESEVHQKLLRAEKTITQAKALTQQLLTFARGGEPVKRVLQLTTLLDTNVRFALSGSNVNCDIQIEGGLKSVEADEGQLGQVINNIVFNAIDSMPDGGTIIVNAENITLSGYTIPYLNEGDYVLISIRDTGIGIPEGYLTKIFDPFFTTKKGGSGLGLASAYSVIKKHGGHIEAESESGTGSTFKIYLPATERAIREKRVRDKEICKGEGRVLFMDDEEIIRSICDEMLTNAGYDVEFAENGDSTIKQYLTALESRKPFDVVILDLTVKGGMGGKETIKRLRSIDPDVKAIVASGYADDPILANHTSYGFHGALCKPYERDELCMMVRDLVMTD